MSDTTNITTHTKANWQSLLTAIMATFAMIAGATLHAEWIRAATVAIDLTNLLNNTQTGYLLLFGISSAPIVLFLLFQLLARIIQRCALSVITKGIVLLATAFGVYSIGAFVLPDASQPYLALSVGGGLIIAALFNFFTAPQSTDFGWSIIAFFVLSAFSTSVLWTNASDHARVERNDLARTLASARDTVFSEKQLVGFYQRVQADPQLPLLLKAWPLKPVADSIRNYLNKVSFEDKYIFRYYKLQIYAFDRDETTPFLLDQFENRPTINTIWDRASIIPGEANLRSDYAENGAHRYIIRSVLNRMNDAAHPVEIFCFFEENYPQTTKVYAQLFTNQPFKNLKGLKNYDFSIARSSQIVVEQGSVSPLSLSSNVAANQVIDTHITDRLETAAASEDGKTIAVVGRPSVGVLNAIYLFSILFAFASSLLLLSGLITRFLPFNLNLLPSFQGSLGRKIYFSYLCLLAIGFMVVGIITFQHFSTSALQKEQAKAVERSQAVVNKLRRSALRLTPDSSYQSIERDLSQFAQSLGIDANLFDTKGHLVFSSREDLRRVGVLPASIDKTAKSQLDAGGIVAETTETIDQQSFTVRYSPLKNNYQQTIAYLGLPYRADKGRTDSELTDFIGILASIYAFLLLVAAGVTYLISNSITQPINKISQTIREVQLEDKNQSLVYDGDPNDEIGDLVNEYNRMVDKLEESKVKLVKFERESAWKDMARQIAHDIKNPLTTMKLTMQQLERVSNDPAQAASYFKKATGRLIEQIDSLAQTASEFQMFASLDKTPRSPVELNHLVESVFDLFFEQKEVGLTLELPDEKYIINGDKNHLLRILNNLVINAIQAIPSDREGKVKVSLLRIADKAIIRISDNGGGIPIEIRTRVFEPNFTTKTTGSGLGLAICKKIIEAHDGDIRFETRDDEGTEFFVELPLVQS